MNGRQSDILDLLKAQKEVSVRALAHRFSVTPTTIRRDLDLLEREGRLTRSHGSALLSSQSVVEFAFTEKGRRHAAQKQAIARSVAAAVQPGMTVALDTGTTTVEVARAIAEIRDITVLTTSLPVAAVLHTHEHLQVILMGGTMRKNDPDLSGVLTEQNLRCFRSNLAVLGADAAGRDGVFTTDLNIARGTQAMMAGAQRRLLAMDSSKFGATALYRYAGWNEFHQVVTDTGVAATDREWLEALGVPVVYVAPESAG